MAAKPQDSPFDMTVFSNGTELFHSDHSMTKLSPHQAREHQAIVAEKVKQLLVMQAQSEKTAIGHQYIEQIGVNQATVLVRAMIKIWALREEVAEPTLKEVVDKVLARTITSMTEWMNAASAAGSAGIIREIGRPLYIEIEERHPGFWEWFLGRRRNGY